MLILEYLSSSPVATLANDIPVLGSSSQSLLSSFPAVRSRPPSIVMLQIQPIPVILGSTISSTVRTPPSAPQTPSPSTVPPPIPTPESVPPVFQLVVSDSDWKLL